MPDTVSIQPTLATHGAERLPKVVVDSYNVELADEEGFVGDRASRRAFRSIIDKWRKPLRELKQDPFGDEASDKLSKKTLDELLAGGHPEAAGILHGAIEDFAQELAQVTRQFLKLKGWRDTQRIVIGGGLRGGRVGELAIGRASVILKAEKIKVDIDMIRHHPDEAGLIGAGISPRPGCSRRTTRSSRSISAATNIRAGVVRLNLRKAADLAKAEVWKSELWRHADEKLNRDDAVQGLIDMLRRLIARAGKDGVVLAPFIGIGCPGRSSPTARSIAARRTCPGTGKARDSTCPARCTRRSPRSGGSKPPSSCTTTPSCRG